MSETVTTLPPQELSKQLEDTIPLDKSWMIRIGMLELAAGSTEMIDFLAEYPDELSDDLISLGRASSQWLEGKPIEVGESGTLFRFMQMLAWSKNEARTFVTSGTLKDRPITADRVLASQSVEELLSYDNNTSQWASAAVLFLDADVSNLQQIPFKLNLTLEAKSHWLSSRAAGQPWIPRKDQTILAQAKAYTERLHGDTMHFSPEQSEDFCFSLAYNLMSVEEGAERWSQLKGHESNRLESVVEAIRQMERGEVITSADHRVVQALAMRFGLSATRFLNPQCVAKSWPRFWEFHDTARGVVRK